MMEFFRHCPGCGRRFHIRLESKKPVHLERNTIQDRTSSPITLSQFRGSLVLLTQEDKPVVVETEEFQYMYKCTHCGHEWSEKRVQEHREG